MSRSGYYDAKDGFVPYDDCPQENPKPTNADRIRSMSDEELEEWLTAFVCSNIAPHATARGAAKKGRLLEWLKQEVE